MPIFRLNENLIFPEIELAEENGLIAIGGDLSSDRLYLAYLNGIFPWYSEGEPILWWSPDPRFVLKTNGIHISKSMKRILIRDNWEFTINNDFNSVISKCKSMPRKGQDGTWITGEMLNAYKVLSEEGKAVSFEIWEDNELIGGMYGVITPGYFAGESMFSLKNNASKLVLIKACEYLLEKGIDLFDCQIYSEHLKSMGAFEMPRSEFKNYLPG
ncbi:MAG: leucyl/phenylalanyl-tRNA--protein transferase [Cytophagales bacterium]